MASKCTLSEARHAPAFRKASTLLGVPMRHKNSSSRLQCGAQQNNNNNFGALLGAAPLGSEKAVELNYSLQVTPFWYVQPVFQYYVDVGANGALPNAAVFGFRTKVNF